MYAVGMGALHTVQDLHSVSKEWIDVYVFIYG